MVLIINIANNHIYESDGEKKSVFMADFFCCCFHRCVNLMRVRFLFTTTTQRFFQISKPALVRQCLCSTAMEMKRQNIFPCDVNFTKKKQKREGENRESDVALHSSFLQLLDVFKWLEEGGRETSRGGREGERTSRTDRLLFHLAPIVSVIWQRELTGRHRSSVYLSIIPPRSVFTAAYEEQVDKCRRVTRERPSADSIRPILVAKMLSELH